MVAKLHRNELRFGNRINGLSPKGRGGGLFDWNQGGDSVSFFSLDGGELFRGGCEKPPLNRLGKSSRRVLSHGGQRRWREDRREPPRCQRCCRDHSEVLKSRSPFSRRLKINSQGPENALKTTTNCVFLMLSEP